MDKLTLMRNELTQLRLENKNKRIKLILRYLLYPAIIAVILALCIAIPRMGSLSMFTKINNETEFEYSLISKSGELVPIGADDQSEGVEEQNAEENAELNLNEQYINYYNKYIPQPSPENETENETGIMGYQSTDSIWSACF